MKSSILKLESGLFRWAESIPGTVWTLGFVSLLMDTSSESIHAVLPLFLVSALGATPATVGLIEGLAEAAAAITKVFSGTLSDALLKRKLLAVLGYGLSALTKPLFALATTPDLVLGARFLDRIGKGIRGAPRDALIGDVVPPHLRGASYGLRQSLDTIGAFAGPLIAVALMALTADSYRVVFWIATIPAIACVALLAYRVREPAHPAPAAHVKSPIAVAELARLGTPYWRLTAVFCLFTLARFSEAFLVLRAANLGLRPEFAPLVIVAMNIVYAASSYPAGLLSDHMDRRRLLGLGFAVLIVADLVLAVTAGTKGLFIGVALWGLHMGLTQGIFSALVADVAAPERRGTAFGIFNLLGGLAMLLASLLAGWLWSSFGPSATFAAGAFFTVIAAAALALPRRETKDTTDDGA